MKSVENVNPLSSYAPKAHLGESPLEIYLCFELSIFTSSPFTSDLLIYIADFKIMFSTAILHKINALQYSFVKHLFMKIQFKNTLS